MTPLPFRLFWLAGRAGRREFAITEALCVIGVSGAGVWQTHHGAPGDYLDAPSALAMLVFFTGATVGTFAVIRRLQDIGEEAYLAGWILIVCWAPAIAAEQIGGKVGELLAPWIMGLAIVIALVVLWCRPSQTGPNKHGPEPELPDSSPPGLG